MSWLASIEKRSNQGFQGARDGSVFAPSEVDLVTIPLPDGLQYGADALAPIFSAEVRASVLGLQERMVITVVMSFGRVKIRHVLQPIFELWFGAPRKGRLKTGRWREMRESRVERGPQFVAQEADPTAGKWGAAGQCR